MRKFTEELLQHTQSKILKVTKRGATGFELYNSCYQILRVTFRQLKKFIIHYNFKNQNEEIEFFKEIKPVFQAQLMYYMELIQIEIRKPTVSERRELVKYYRNVSCHYQGLLKRNELFMQYIRTQLTNGDHLMFVRSSEAEQMLLTDILDLDDRFSTPASSELGKIKAHEMLIEHMGDKVMELKTGEALIDQQPFSTIWTGSKVALIELAYALHASKMINHGMVDIRQIIQALEGIFKIQLTDFYRVFQNIRIRQGSRTTFLDELKEKILERMDDTDMNYRE
ncbi:MAG: hypothetical protein BGO31_20800 [Bacteroidetes bacterium 43-16]|uniref:RteC domain-containing protein n=1 Tax=uncultured Dysgonomonas sp. TaxID=206096 RepID=UPI0009260D22|nr:RteC domain-containing protein [uncultured Dysgonomonas sp.]OJV55371.1 MAG: hypothetical protein BGO31_20800 [Bacteroidetes bacterium 43-16]